MRELEDNTMAKKHGLAKVVLGVGAAAVAGKVAFDKFKQTKERFAKEENDSFDDENTNRVINIFEPREEGYRG